MKYAKQKEGIFVKFILSENKIFEQCINVLICSF